MHTFCKRLLLKTDPGLEYFIYTVDLSTCRNIEQTPQKEFSLVISKEEGGQGWGDPPGQPEMDPGHDEQHGTRRTQHCAQWPPQVDQETEIFL